MHAAFNLASPTQNLFERNINKVSINLENTFKIFNVGGPGANDNA
jgi:hypothetical protein